MDGHAYIEQHRAVWISLQLSKFLRKVMDLSQDSIVSSNLWRSSKIFIYTVVNLAVFTDAYLYGLIIPVLPFALTEVVNVDKGDVQWWIGVLLAAYGTGLLVGARKYYHPSCSHAC